MVGLMLVSMLTIKWRWWQCCHRRRAKSSDPSGSHDSSLLVWLSSLALFFHDKSYPIRIQIMIFIAWQPIKDFEVQQVNDKKYIFNTSVDKLKLKWKLSKIMFKLHRLILTEFGEVKYLKTKMMKRVQIGTWKSN